MLLRERDWSLNFTHRHPQADVQAVSDGCNAVKYNLTTDVIQAIFRTYPSVRAKHAELVPEKMPEKEFWGKFFQSQLFHRETGSGPKSLFSDVLVKEHKGERSCEKPCDFTSSHVTPLWIM